MIRPEDLEAMSIPMGHLTCGDDDLRCWCKPRVVHIASDGTSVAIHGLPSDGEPPQEVVFDAIVGAEYGIDPLSRRKLN